MFFAAPSAAPQQTRRWFDRIFLHAAHRSRVRSFSRSSSKGRALKPERSPQPRDRFLAIIGAFLCAVALALGAAPAGQSTTQAPASAPTQAPTQPPGAPVNLDAIGAKKLPDGPGKQIVLISCKDCHTFDRITSAHHSLARWRVIVHEMEQRGANVDPGDVTPLIQYLAKNFGVRHTAAKPTAAAPPKPPGSK
jgi:hypothetical protein